MDEQRRILLLKLGFFPVTDDFWAGADMPMCVGEGWGWAFRLCNSKQKFMPWKEETLLKQTDEELKLSAWKQLSERY